MKNKIIRRIDNQNRLQLPSMLMDFVNLTDEKILAICPEENNMIKLIKMIKAKDNKIIGFVKRMIREGLLYLQKFVKKHNISKYLCLMVNCI